MYKNDKKRIIDRYNKRIEEFGPNIKGLASGKEERRMIQFRVLTEIGDLNNKRILDLGCGFGDLFYFLMRSYKNINYTGLDINPKIIDIAQKRNNNANFICGDFLELKLPKYDYILSASTFNNRWFEIDNYVLVTKIFEKAYSLSRDGVAIDFLTDYVDYKIDDEIFFYSPEEIFRIAKRITKRVTLRHDYPLFQFCIYLYKDFKGWH